MTVKELIEKLQQEDPETEVVTRDYEYGYFQVNETTITTDIEINQGFGMPKRKVQKTLRLM